MSTSSSTPSSTARLTTAQAVMRFLPSALESTQRARDVHEQHKATQRPYLAPSER